jgi:putative FmdB family regulatory protein
MRYDYQCNACTEIFEVKHPMNFKGVVLCPVCESGDTHKIILSCAAIKFAWRDPRSSSDALGLKPKYLGAVNRRPSRPTETASDFGGN